MKVLFTILSIILLSNITHAQKYKAYYADGTLKEIGRYKKEKPVGKWRFYHENGELLAEGKYKDSLKEGEWNYYHDSGELMETGLFVAGKKEGESGRESPEVGRFRSEAGCHSRVGFHCDRDRQA